MNAPVHRMALRRTPMQMTGPRSSASPRALPLFVSPSRTPTRSDAPAGEKTQQPVCVDFYVFIFLFFTNVRFNLL